jgi:hypothetical protein
LAGCGDDAGDRAGSPRSELQTISPAELERNAGVELPSGLSDFRAQKEVGALDDSISASFTIPRDALDSMRSILSEPLEEGFQAISDRPSLGWEVEDSGRFLGGGDIVKGVGRNVLVDLDVPGRPAVYLVAGTVA